ncbi:MAG: transcriptional repressor [Clostridiales bacterium]|nr:transcriptional repressor [Clostridiales bacterium]
MGEKRNTYQKSAIFQTLKEMKNHPTAAMVYDKLLEDGYFVSKATVYRVLVEAASEGTIQRIYASDREDRYDFRCDPHYHFRCRKCGALLDASTPYQEQLDREERLVDGFYVENHQTQFSGICSQCLEKEQGKKS